MYKYITMTLIALGACLGGSHAQNLITNGSFAASGANWTFFAPATTTEAYNAETSYGGTNAGNIVAEIDAEANLRQSNIAVNPGQSYGVSFRHSRRTGNGAAPNPSVFKVKVYDATNTYIDQTITNSNSAWNLQCQSYTFTPSGNSVTIEFENVTATTLGSIVDDITMSPLTQSIAIDGTACEGGSVTLHAPNFPGDPDNNYTNHSWTGPGGFTATGADLTLNNLQSANSGVYTCNMLLNGCLAVQASYELIVTAHEYTRDVAICAGNTYDFYGRILTQAGNYDTVIVNGANLCDSLIHLNLTIIPNPDATLLNEPELRICAGDQAILRLAGAGQGNSYQWYIDNQIIPGATAATYNADQMGTYHVVVRRNGCATTSATVNLRIMPLPFAQIAAQTNIACAQDTTTLRAQNPNAQYVYYWQPISNFSQVTGHEGAVVRGTFTDPSTTVYLTVVDNNGCISRDTGKVTTVACCEVMMPNAFTPNGDGRNDYFIPVMEAHQKVITFEVYDRYGQMVYNGWNDRNGWGGHYPNGKPAIIGVYMYILKYDCSDGLIHTKKGDVSLLR